MEEAISTNDHKCCDSLYSYIYLQVSLPWSTSTVLVLDDKLHHSYRASLLTANNWKKYAVGTILRNGTERNGTERNGTERNGTE